MEAWVGLAWYGVKQSGKSDGRLIQVKGSVSIDLHVLEFKI
jgi:hypothetical protein